MDNTQIKNEAWRLLWNREWFWRIFGGTMLLGICTGAISAVVNGIINATCTFTPSMFREIVLKKGQMPELTPGLVWGLSVTVLISAFLGLIMNGIRDYGRAVLQVRASDDMDGRWLEAAFSGFKMPLGLAWLWLRLCLVFLPWAILATIAGMALLIPVFVLYHSTGLGTVEAVALCTICATLAVCVYLAIMSIPFYRYRYVLRIRADHPDWSASMCLRNCRELVHGQKWRIFKHDCSYWQIILVSLAVELAALLVGLVTFSGSAYLWASNMSSAMVVAIMALLILAFLFLIVAYMALVLVINNYIGVGQTLLYREIALERENAQNEEVQ